MSDDPKPEDFAPANISAVIGENGSSIYSEQRRKDGDGFSGVHIIQTQTLGDPSGPTEHWLNCLTIPTEGSGIDPITQPGSAAWNVTSRPIPPQEFEVINQEIRELGSISPQSTISENDARRLSEKHCRPFTS